MSTSPRPDGRQQRWLRHKEERRRAVIDAAIELLEENAPGTELHVQEIASRAGLNRSVIYRHFKDRNDLDLAVQQAICAQVGEVMLPAISLDGTPREIVHRIVAAYVSWAAAHPSLVRFVEHEVPGQERPLEAALEAIAQQVEMVIETFVSALDIELSAEDRDSLEPWVFGLIGGCFQSVQRWTGRDRLAPGADYFVTQISDVVWFQIDGLARKRNIEIPDEPVERLILRFTGLDAEPSDL